MNNDINFVCNTGIESEFPTVVNWVDGDSLKNFKKNCKSQPANWPWRNTAVNYTINSLGFRAPEFDVIDWSDSLVIFGCSHVFGIGLDDSQTISSQLSRIIKKPVINLGVAGSSMQISYINLLTLLEKYPKPLGIINCWTDYTRILTTNRQGEIENSGPWSRSEFYRAWSVVDSNPLTYAKMVQATADRLCKNLNIWHCQVSYFDQTAEALSVPLIEKVDLARDLSHSGPETHKRAAESIANLWRNR